MSGAKPIGGRRPVNPLWELRAIGELGAFMAAAAPGLALAPRGERTVLVLPGFIAGDRSTMGLRLALRSLGHDVHGWGLGTNVGPVEHVASGLREVVDRLVRRADGPIDILGWSLGGVYGRVLASNRPEDIRQVITMGTPIRMYPGESTLSGAFSRASHLFGFREPRAIDVDRIPVPSTCIWSASDGVVPGRACLQTVHERAENVEVHSSHLGFPLNPTVLWVIADRLAQADGAWAPFEPPPWLRHVIPGGDPSDPATEPIEAD